ncbi:MAG: amidohydrolase family protein [Betaproteobacteria bacterium]|nr:amidohydrolase family protein [Betaproteobacteria bacterium]
MSFPAEPNNPPLCAAFDPNPRAPGFKLPPGATDCHAHICGPAARYPYFPERIYTPADALLTDYQHMLATLGVERAVLVQPSVYGTDNTAMLDAMKTAPAKLRGVAVVAEDVSDAELKRMHEAGVRGVRVNIVDVKDRKAGTLPLAALKKLALKVKPFGWHMEFLMHVDEFPDLDRMLEDFPVETVYGHFGYMKTDHGTGNPGFQALLRMMQAGRAWVKLTGPYRISAQPLPHADTNAYAHSLLRAAPAQVVWGSDWPHVMVKGVMPNDGDLAAMLATSIADAALRKQVLVDNPARLYGFN